MADNTPRLNIPYPEGGDGPPDVAVDIQAVAERVDATTLSRDQGPKASRGPAGTAGRVYWSTDETVESPMSYDDGVAWRSVPGPGLIPIGGRLDWPWASQPPGPAVWLECLGQTVTRDAYPELLDAAGVPGASMVIPDCRGRSPIGAGKGPGLSANPVVGQLIGGESVTLSVNQLPSHGHSTSVSAAGGHTHGMYGAGDHQHSYLHFGLTGAWSFSLGTLPNGPPGSYTYLTFSGTADAVALTNTTGNHTHVIADAGSHAHAVTVNSTGLGHPITIQPPAMVTRYFVRAR